MADSALWFVGGFCTASSIALSIWGTWLRVRREERGLAKPVVRVAFTGVSPEVLAATLNRARQARR